MTKRKKIIIASLVLVTAVTGSGLYYWWTHRIEPARTTSKSRTAQSDYSSGKPRDSNPSSGNSQGGATDTHGDDVVEDTEGVTSESGLITVQSPAREAMLATGSILSGKTEGVNTVRYRIIDEDVGVVAQGTLASETGSFSGKLQFTPRATTGRVDVFSLTVAGEEVNIVEIPVRFKE